MVLLTTVLAVFYRGLDGMQIATRASEERLSNLEEARVMMAQVTKDLRAAARFDNGSPTFDAADARAMTFYANLGTTSVPSKVRIYVDAEQPSDRGSDPGIGNQSQLHVYGNPQHPGGSQQRRVYGDHLQVPVLQRGNVHIRGSDRRASVGSGSCSGPVGRAHHRRSTAQRTLDPGGDADQSGATGQCL